MKESLILFLQFLKDPKDDPFENQQIRNKIKWLFYLLILEFPVLFIVSIFQNIPDLLGLVDSSDNAVFKFIIENTIFKIFLSAILVGPLFEELIFRLPLRLKRFYFIPFFLMVILLTGTYIIHLCHKTFNWIYFLPILLLAVIVFMLIFNKKRFEKISRFFFTYYKVFFYSVTILFAFIHLTNFKFSIYLLLFAPLIVLPQFIAGLILGFIRVKFNVFWSYLFHFLHNAIFVLPVILYLNTPKLVAKFEKDGYSFEVNEGFPKDVKRIKGRNIDVSLRKIAPKEIELHDSFRNVVSALTRTNKNYIVFKNKWLAEKKISLYLKNDSAFKTEKTDTISKLALENLLKAYHVHQSKKEQWAPVWEISIFNSEGFKTHISPTDTVEVQNSVRPFYSRNDTLKLNHTNCKNLSRVLEINFKVDVKNSIDEKIVFSLEIPNNEFSDLNKFLKSNYGLQIKKIEEKKLFTIVE